MTEVNPGIPAMARANRDFIAAAVRKVAEAGVEQFLDLGAGLPTSPAVHEAARAVNPDAQVVYVDSDPVVVSHASALLATKPGIYALDGDLPNRTRFSPTRWCRRRSTGPGQRA
jgi:hypothetical protein